MILAYRRSFCKRCSSFPSIILISVLLLLLLSIISFIFVQAYQENAMALSSSIEEKEEEVKKAKQQHENFGKENTNEYIRKNERIHYIDDDY